MSINVLLNKKNKLPFSLFSHLCRLTLPGNKYSSNNLRRWLLFFYFVVVVVVAAVYVLNKINGNNNSNNILTNDVIDNLRSSRLRQAAHVIFIN